MINQGRGKSFSVSVDIIQTIAEQKGVDPDALPPLYDYINPDALDSLFESTQATNRHSGHLKFSYAGHLITVSFDQDRTIIVTEESDH